MNRIEVTIRTDLTNSKHYVLRELKGDRFVTVHDDVLTKERTEARSFHGDYLRSTVWDWERFYSAQEAGG